MGPHDVLVEPLYGCWESNMSDAMARRPVDICLQRDEPRVVVGNAGVVRVVETGREVTGAKPGDVCMLFGSGAVDQYGFVTRALAYDAPGTM
ncbi:MAG: zinc-binding alcohol dehydrogenase family protein, partial [Deltaproteobacteria bacterium]